MLRRILITLQLAAAATSLALTLYVRAVQNPTWAGAIRLPTDRVWLLASTRGFISAELLDDRLRLHCVLQADAQRVAPMAATIRAHRDELASIPLRDDRPWSFPEPFQGGLSSQGLRLGFPLWAATLLLCLHPTIALSRGPYLRYRRRRAGRCVACGYDLTGLSGTRCPECGHALVT